MYIYIYINICICTGKCIHINLIRSAAISVCVYACPKETYKHISNKFRSVYKKKPLYVSNISWFVYEKNSNRCMYCQKRARYLISSIP